MKIELQEINSYYHNKFLLIVIITIFMLANFSCSSFRKIENNNDRIELTKENINLLDGIYLNNSEVAVLPLDYFWGKIYKTKEYSSVYDLVYERKIPYHVKIETMNEKQIQVTIIVNNKVVKSHLINGKITNGYFEQRRKIHLIPLIIFNNYHNSKFRIGKLKNDNLITDYIQKDYAHYVLGFKNNTKNSLNIEHYKVINDSIK